MASSLYLFHSSRHPYQRTSSLWHPMILTTAAIAFYPIQFASTITIFALAARSSSKSWESWQEFEGQISTLASSWQPGEKFVMTGRESWIPTLTVFVFVVPSFRTLEADALSREQIDDVFDWVSKAFTLHVVYLFFVLAIFLPLSFFYGRMLR